MERRTFNKIAATAALGIGAMPLSGAATSKPKSYVRLGGPIFEEVNAPDDWIKALKKNGYRAAYCPVSPGADWYEIDAYRKAAEQNDIVISEVGAWSNPLAADEKMRKEAIEKCIAALQLADKIGANCAVNISGSRNPDYWAGPHEDNLTDETFNMIVEVTREIIDTVDPKNTFFALEPMPWAFPDSADNYLRLLRAIDRKQFGVHFDPVNMVVSPQLFYSNGAMIKDCFKKLGPYLRSCHAKDITLREDNYIPQLDECAPGLGKLDYTTFLTELAIYKDIPLMMEHLKTAEEYNGAASYIRTVGQEVGIEL